MTTRKRFKGGTLAGQVWSIVWTALAVIPFILIVLLAFKSNSDIYSNPLGIIGVDWSPQNFAEAWNGPSGTEGFVTYLINSALVAVVAVAGCLLLGALTGYFATIASARVSRAVISACIIATTLPLIMLLIPYFSAFNSLNVLSQPWALGIIYIALCLPTSTLILNSFYRGFPNELREAAALDRLGPFATFRRIVLPLSKGPLVAVGLVNGFFVWGETQLAIVLLQDPASRTVPVGVLSFSSTKIDNTAAIFAALTMATIPLIVVYLVFNKSIAKGVALGGVFR